MKTKHGLILGVILSGLGMTVALAAPKAVPQIAANATANTAVVANVSLPTLVTLPNTKGLDKILAVVNNDVITQSEVDTKLAAYKSELIRARMPMPPASELQQKILDNLIDITLQKQLAKRNNIKVTDDELAHAIKVITENNRITEDKLKQELQKEGITFAAFRDQIREQILLEKVEQQAFGGEITVTEADIAAAMRTPPKVDPRLQAYQVIDVLVPVPEHATAAQIKAAKDLATELMPRIAATIKITAVISGEQVNGQEVKSVDLGMRRLDGLPEVFALAVMKMQIGEVSQPIEAPNGFHLLKVVDIKGGAAKAKMTREQAEQIAYHQKVSERLVSWIKEVRAGAYIKIMDDNNK